MRAGFEANHAVQAGNPHLSYTIVNGKAVTKKAPNGGAAGTAAFSPRSEVMVRRYWGRGGTIRRTMLSARTPTRFLTGLLASGSLVVALTTSPATSVPLPKPRPQSTPAKAGTTPSAPAPQAAARPTRSALAPSDLPSAADIAALKEAIAAARRGKTTQAADLQKTISDPVARKLVEWQILRSDDTQSIDVSRYMAFITENPSWPSTALMRRRAEATLWADRLDPAFVRAFYAKATLDAVPREAQRDAGYMFSRAQYLRRADEAADAADWILAVPADPGQTLDTDQWWIQRRHVARKLLDLDDAKTAYRVVRDAAIPQKDNYRAEHQFTAGWIALRFLNDPTTALAHFAKVAQGNSNPIALGRAGYWQGRAAEALGRKDEARGHYEAAARYSTAYYGQIARARLGHKDIVVRPPPAPAPAALEVVRAVEILYAIDERDLVAGIAVDLGERSTDAAGLAALGEL